jgi:hypothetical protein
MIKSVKIFLKKHWFTYSLVGCIALSIGASVTTINGNIQEQARWQELAQSAEKRAKTILEICAKQPEFTGRTLTQSTDCAGNTVPLFGGYLDESRKSDSRNGWRSKFTIKKEYVDKKNHTTRFSVKGTLETLGDASIVRKVYSSESSVIIDLDEVSTTRMRNYITNSNAYCVIRPTNLRLYCAFTQYYGKNLTEFILPSGEYVKDYRLLYGLDLSASSGCVLTNQSNLYCAGANANAIFSNQSVNGLITWDGTDPNLIGSNGIAGPVKIDAPTGATSLQVTGLWEGVNFGENMCFLAATNRASDGNVFCTGINAMGNFGNGLNHRGTTNVNPQGRDVGNPNNFFSGTYPPVPAFNTGDINPSSGARTVKKIYGHFTYNPQQAKYLDRAASFPSDLNPFVEASRGCWNPFPTFDYPNCTYLHRHSGWRRCVLTTDKATQTNDQLYCAGVCSNTHGGIVFGTAPKGSGALGCGISNSAPSTAPTQSGGITYNATPDDYGGEICTNLQWFGCVQRKGRECYPSVWENNLTVNLTIFGWEPGLATDSKARCYWKPARFWLPNGVTVKQVNIGFGTTRGSYLCVYGSDKKTYCTFSTEPGLNSGITLFNVSEPTDIEDKDIYNFGQPYPNPNP